VREFTAAGEQYLWAENGTDAVASLSFVATLLTAESTPLVFDAPQTVVLSSIGERKVFSFAAQEGQLLYFDGLDPAFSGTKIRLIDQTTGESLTFGGQSELQTSDHSMYNMPRTGNYSLVVGNHVGTFHFRLMDVRNAPLVPLDTNFTGSIAGNQQATVWRFRPTPYQKLFIDSNATAAMRFESPLQMFRPNNLSGGSTSAAIDNDLSTTAGDEGDHYLVASGGAIAFNYDLRIRTPDTTTLPVTFGSIVSGQLDDPTEIDEFTFAGTRGQRIHLDRLGTTSNISITLLAPDGSTLATAGDHSYLLPQTGMYRAQLTGAFPQPYQFVLLDPATQPLLPLDTPVIGSTTAADVRLFRLPATAGQRFTFDSQTLTGAAANVRWLLYSPQGTEVFDVAFAGGDQTVTLTESGNYLLALRSPSGAIDYSFQVNTIVQTPVTSSGLNQTYSGSIPGGQSVDINFTANAGQRVYLDVLDRSSFQPSVRLFGPGDVVVTSSVTQDGWLSVPFSGAYRLQLSSSSATTYNLRLTDAASLTPITVGTPFTVALDQLHESLIFPLDATVGDRRLFELAQSSFNGSFTLWRPDGTSVSASDTQNSPRVTTFTQTGRHYLVLKGTTLPTPVTWSAVIWDPALAPAIQFDTSTSGQLSPATEYHLYSIDLTAGERVYVEPTAWSVPNAGDWGLFDPTGVTVSNATSNNLSLPFAFTATKTGKYTLVLFASTGLPPFDYTFRVNKVALSEVTGVAFDHGFGD
jgi:hypothetical protein